MRPNKADALRGQAERMRAKATKARQAQSMLRRADALVAGLEPQRRQERTAALRFPQPLPCGRVPLAAEGLSKSYGFGEIFMDVDLAIDRGARVVVLGLNGAGKTTLLRICWPVNSSPTPATSSEAMAWSPVTTPRSTRPWTGNSASWRTWRNKPLV